MKRLKIGQAVGGGFCIGDRVRMNADGRSYFLHKTPTDQGTVVGASHNHGCIAVLRDGQKAKQTWNAGYWEKIPSLRAAAPNQEGG